MLCRPGWNAAVLCCRGAAHLLRVGAWAWLSLIACVFSWHPHACFLFASSIQDVNGRWVLFFSFKTCLEPFSHAAWSASSNQLITSASLCGTQNLADPLWFCLNRTNLWEGGLNWVITSSSYYHSLTICQKAAAASPPVCSAPILWGNLAALPSRARRAPLFVFVLPSISGI